MSIHIKKHIFKYFSNFNFLWCYFLVQKVIKFFKAMTKMQTMISCIIGFRLRKAWYPTKIMYWKSTLNTLDSRGTFNTPSNVGIEFWELIVSNDRFFRFLTVKLILLRLLGRKLILSLQDLFQTSKLIMKSWGLFFVAQLILDSVTLIKPLSMN